MAKIERLECTVKNYAWGKLGHGSEVARLFAAGHEQAEIGHSTPYAELWIGTHPDGIVFVKLDYTIWGSIAIADNYRRFLRKFTITFPGPAVIRSKKIHLSEHIAEGDSINTHLPFIMKIMSIEHTLSLQVHPTKEQAIVLNRKDPLNYPDQNHKPELAYALSQFELLCGFRPMHEIVQNMKAFPELCQAMGTFYSTQFIAVSKLHSADSAEMKNALKKCFTNMMNLEKENVHELLAALGKRIENGEKNGVLTDGTIVVLKDMLWRFPNDIGCLSPLFLNHICLEPSECVYYGAQELHAYLSGECVECVSCSNNTIRAGLTNKFVDRQNLLEVLNFRMVEPEFYYVHPNRLPSYPHVSEFAPEDCKDFTLQRVDVEIDENDCCRFPVALLPLGCSSTFVLVESEGAICMELNKNGNIIGDKFSVKRGDIFYIPPLVTLQFLDAKGPLKGFRTYSFETGPDHSKRILAKQISVKESLKLNKTELPMPKTVAAIIYDIETEMDGFLG